MANELSWADLETNAGIAHMLSGLLRALLYDPTDLRETMMQLPFMVNGGSESTKVTQYDRAQPFAAASSELVGGAANSDIGDASYIHSLTRYLKKWQMTSLWHRIAPTGSLDLGLLAGILDEGVGQTFTDLLVALFPSLSTSVGSTVQQMNLDFLFDAQYQLNNTRAVPPFTLVISPHMMNRLTNSIRGEGGSIQFAPATREMLDAKGPGFKGDFGPIGLWDSDSVTLDGGSTYRRGALYDGMCFEYQLAQSEALGGVIPAGTVQIVNSVLRIVQSYNEDDGLINVIGDFYGSVIETEDARGVEVRALAS